MPKTLTTPCRVRAALQPGSGTWRRQVNRKANGAQPLPRTTPAYRPPILGHLSEG